MTHTAGPWEPVLIDDPRGQPVPFYRGLICTVEHGSRYLSVVASDGRTVEPEEWADNCRLLARAPELLAQISEARAALVLIDGRIDRMNELNLQTPADEFRTLFRAFLIRAKDTCTDALAKLDATEQPARLEGSPT